MTARRAGDEKIMQVPLDWISNVRFTRCWLEHAFLDNRKSCELKGDVLNCNRLIAISIINESNSAPKERPSVFGATMLFHGAKSRQLPEQ
jgi:hypothetical protein